MKLNIYYKIILFLFLSTHLVAQESNTDGFLRDHLMVYYVEDPSSDQYRLLNPREIASTENLFGGNPQMEAAQQLIRAIFPSGENREYQQTVAEILRNYENPVALFLYSDEGPIDEAIASENWTNCIESGHFTSCVTVEAGDEYAGIVHYGSTQMSSDGINLAKNRFTTLLQEIGGTSFGMPLGKGMFVENIHGAEPSAAGFAQRARENGISWVAFKGATQDTLGITRNDQNRDRSIVTEYIQNFRNQVENAKVYIWGWPTANSNMAQYRRFIDLLLQKAQWIHANGIILDIEGPIHGIRATGWNRGDTSAKMRILMDYALREAHQRGISVSVSSFGTAVRGFPWSQMKRADFGIPQLYSPRNEIFDDSGNVLAAHRNYVQRGIQLWQDETRGFRNRIVVASATITRGRKTATHVRNLLDITTPHLTNHSIAWWVWHSTQNSRSPMTEGKWEVIRDYNFDATTASN